MQVVVVERWVDRNSNAGEQPKDMKLACQELIAMLQSYRDDDKWVLIP